MNWKKLYFKGHKSSYIQQNIYFALCLAFCFSGSVWAQDIALKPMIQQYVEQQIPHGSDDIVQVDVSQIDPNYNLSACQTALIPSMAQDPQGGMANAVKISCMDEHAWHLFVPISIHVMTKVLCASRVIAQGEPVGVDDVIFDMRDKTRLMDGYYTDMSEFDGMTAARTLAAGTTITKKNLRRIAIIKKNQTISLVLKRGGIEISMMGVAKTDGYLHETIKVLNPSSKKIVDAVVVASDRAEIG